MKLGNNTTSPYKAKNAKSKTKLLTISFCSSFLLMGSILLTSTEAFASNATAKATDVKSSEYLSHLVKHKKYKKKNKHKKRNKHNSDDTSSGSSGNSDICDSDSSSSTHFVQAGGTCTENCSASNPYGSLAEVQNDTSPGDVICVIASADVLDGKIVLKPNQQIRGVGPDPVKGGVGPFATLTSSTARAVIEATGNNKISNLHIKDSHAAAIDLTFGSNVIMDKLLITGHNQGLFLIQDLYPAGPLGLAGEGSSMSAILAYPRDNLIPKPSGKLIIKQSRIENGNGSGIQIFVRNAFDGLLETPITSRAKRAVKIVDTELKNLDASRITNPAPDYHIGISLFVGGDNSLAELDVKHSIIDTVVGAPENSGIYIPTGTCTSTTSVDCYQHFSKVNIQHSEIRNLEGTGTAITFSRETLYTTDESVVDIHHNLIEDNGDGVYFALPLAAPGSKVAIDMTHNIIRRMAAYDGLFVEMGTASMVDVNYQHNTLEDLGVAFGIIAAPGFVVEYGPQAKVVMKNNYARNFFAGIYNDTEGMNWKSLEVRAEKNCFESGDFGIYDENVFSYIPGDNNATIDAGGGPLGSKGKNAFIDMRDVDIFFDQADIYAFNNYWSGGIPSTFDLGGGGSLFVEPQANNNPNFCFRDDDSDSSDSSDSSNSDSSSS